MNIRAGFAAAALAGLVIVALYAAQFPTGTPPQFNAPAPVQQVGGVFVSYSPTQLGVNGIALPASGQTANSNIIDFRGVKAATLFSQCTQNWSQAANQYMEDGVTVFTQPGTIVSGLTANQAAGISWSTESTAIKLILGGTAGNASTVPYLPQRAVSFFWLNATATAGTCTARLFLAY